MIEKVVLILTNSRDGEHTDSVISHLEKMRQPFFRLNVDEVARGDTKLVVSSDLSFEFIEGNDKLVVSRDVGSVWYRRPFYYESPIKDPVQKAHAEKELDHLFEGLWRTLDGVFWINHPVSLELARKKIVQLQLAQRIGLSVPKSLVTNDPNKARDFIHSCKDGAVFKNIHTGFLDYGDKAFVVPTTLITPALTSRLDLIRFLPGLFQERIVKDHELRITIVGDSIFAVRINSQKFPETQVDWRHPKLINKLDYSEANLPSDLTDKLVVMMKHFGLHFGAFDLAVDPEGRYWFFEVNGNGQWYWLEHETGLLISKAIADSLANGASSKLERG